MSKEHSTIELPNGTKALNLLPDFNGQAVIVPLSMVKRLASMLPTARLDVVVESLVSKVREEQNLVGYVEVLEEEVAFHRTVNLLKTIDINGISTETESVEKYANY